MQRQESKLRREPRHRARLLCLAAIACALGWGQPARAADFPVRPVRVVVPFAPGAAADTVARLIANGLSKKWGQQVIVDNRSGGNTVIGMENVVRSEPDGYTLLFTVNDSFTTVPHLYTKLPIDPLKDLTPINLSAKVVMVMVASASSSISSFSDLIERARAHPGALSYGSYGSGSSVHLSMETLKALANVDLIHVPYRGVAPATAAVAAGEVAVSQTGYGSSRGLIDSGRIKPIAIASAERIRELPGVPTLGELGYRQAETSVWWGFAAPVKTPPELIEKINKSISEVLQNPEVRKQIEGRSLTVADLGPHEFAAEIKQESKEQGEAVRRFGVKVE
ncbi:MAG: Bug family tripartite tricarboxylate transporter substrate binding protein [Pigmentiphaga sp.]|uniref:Bug family tripartite tricarboxylate transporter substrate binding protein n=1 Tax=Pigmentiphaga sp. TaxID=1977564 RepID=UPI003B54E9C7